LADLKVGLYTSEGLVRLKPRRAGRSAL